MKKIILITALVVLSVISTNSINADWSKINSAGNVYFMDILVDGSSIYAVSLNSGVYRSTDATASWQQLNSGLSNSQSLKCTHIIKSGVNFYVSTYDGIYKSTDNAASWVKKSDGLLIGNGALYLFCESIFEINGELITGAYSGIYRSTNGGDNWLTTNITNGMHIWAKNFTLHNGILYAARETGNDPDGYKSTDNGITWQNIQPLDYPSICFLSEGTKLFAGTIHGAWLTTNNGQNWVHRATGLSPDPYNSSFLRVNGLLLTSLKFGGSGIYISSNDGVQWNDFGQGLPSLSSIEELILLNTKVIAATSGGLYERNISELTGINQVSTEIPEKFMLEQNYPNPFNPTTTISFSAAHAGFVSLKLYDALGREVKQLVNGNLSAGTYEVTVDASQMQSGVYFYRLKAGNFTETKRMVLVK